MSTPTYVRVAARPVDNYSIIPNALIRDRRLSDHARMLAIWLLSHRADFGFDTAAMGTAMGVGRDRTRTSLRELEAVGYLRRRHVREQGRLVAIEYDLSDASPHVSTSDGFPGAGADLGEVEGPDTQGRIPRAGYPGPENPSPIKKTKYEEDQKPEDQQDQASPGDAVDDGGLFAPPPPPASTRKRPDPDPVNVAAKQLADHWHTLNDGIVNYHAARTVIVKALRANRPSDAVKVALDQIHADARPLTAATLEIQLRAARPGATTNGYRPYRDDDYWSKP